MKGLMASLIIFLLAGTAFGQQASSDAANTAPELSAKQGANSFATIDDGSQFERPGPDDSADDNWPTPQSVLGGESTTTSRSMSAGGQTNFSGRSQRLSDSSRFSSGPTQDTSQQRGIRFDVMLRAEDLASVKRGGTLVAPVDIRDKQDGSQRDPSVVSDIAFFHEANAGKSTGGEFIRPEPIEPGSRNLRFKLTADQLNRMGEYAYQFSVPNQMRGKFDNVEFFAEETAGRGQIGPADSGNGWNTSLDLAKSKPRDEGSRFGSPLKREDGDGIQPPNLRRPIGNRFDGFTDKDPKESRFGGVGSTIDGRKLGDRFGVGQPQDVDDADQELWALKAQLKESQRREFEARKAKQQWESEAIDLAGQKSQLLNEKARIRRQLENASRPGEGEASQLGPIKRPFGTDRNDFLPNREGRDFELELARKKIEQLEQENQLVSKDFKELAGYSETLLDKYRRETSRRSADDTTEKVKSYMDNAGALAGPDPIGPRFASNGGFQPPLGATRTPVGLGGVGNSGTTKNPSGALSGNKTLNGQNPDVPWRTDFFLWFMLLISVALNFYLIILCRSLYVRYSDLADELREMFSATSA
jgi:hypothetical protein